MRGDFTMPATDKKVIIFGAGMHGQQALKMMGDEKVAYFLDNNAAKHGTFCNGKEIVGFDKIEADKDKYHFVIASQYISSMKQDLAAHGISDYEVFRNYLFSYYETPELVFNPYESVHEASSEKEWNESEKLRYSRKEVFEEVEELYGKDQLFNHIEVETINRCNGTCAFCPVNRNVDPREETKMSEELFYSIVDQLSAMDYSGKFTTFSNNEPLLDERIIEFNRYARAKLPKARMHLFTNGTLMTIDKFIALTDILDELVIDNYQQDLKLIKPCQEIKEYVDLNPELELNKKVTIVLRKPIEILTSRGGDAPNRETIGDYSDDRCVLPYKQMIVRPDGKVSLCCNDATGKFTLGDLRTESIKDVWFGTRFKKVREALYKGRKYCGNCKMCDTFTGG